MALRSTEQTLRKCMIRLMRKKQLKNIRVEEICELAQIGKRTFYRYYHDKYELFEDTYRKEFYEKLEIGETEYLFDIFDRILNQIYEEKDFYAHAISAKEQNGFWELMLDLIVPNIANRVTQDPLIEEAKARFIKNDIRLALFYIERWIKDGYKMPPEDVSDFIRMCYIYHGKWQYQMSKGVETEDFSLEKYRRGEY